MRSVVLFVFFLQTRVFYDEIAQREMSQLLASSCYYFSVMTTFVANNAHNAFMTMNKIRYFSFSNLRLYLMYHVCVKYITFFN